MSYDGLKEFLLTKWQDRAKERAAPVPRDLSMACKFVSLFVSEVFGGEIEANEFHTWVRSGSAIIDPTTDSADTKLMLRGQIPKGMKSHFATLGIHAVDDLYAPDRRFMASTDFRESLDSCRSRVQEWIEEWTLLNEKVIERFQTAYLEPWTLFLNPSVPEFRNLCKNLKETDDETALVRALLDLQTGDLWVWDGYYATHGGIIDKYGIAHAAHLILSDEPVSHPDISVQTMWRYERLGYSEEDIRDKLAACRPLNRIMGAHARVHINP